MKCHHPNVFDCALLNAQPMGFYAIAQIVGDARKHGVEVRPIRAFTSRSEVAQISSVVSIDAPVIHGLLPWKPIDSDFD